MSSPIAAAVSAPSPLPGEESRSGPNFLFLNVPSPGNLVTANLLGANGVGCALMQQITGEPDVYIAGISNGSTFDAAKVRVGTNYYLASPSGASGQNFEVTFIG